MVNVPLRCFVNTPWFQECDSMGFMNVFVFFIITAEVHIHPIPNNRIPKAQQARNCYEKTKKERLRFLFLATFSFSVPGFFFFSCSWFLFLFSQFMGLPLVSTSDSLQAHRIHRTSIERPAIQTRFVRFQSAADILQTVNRDPFYFSASEYIQWTSSLGRIFWQKLDILWLCSLRHQ